MFYSHSGTSLGIRVAFNTMEKALGRRAGKAKSIEGTGNNKGKGKH